MPGPREIARRLGATLLFTSVLPMALFYMCYRTSGLRVAVGVTVGWYYVGLVLRLLRGKPFLGALACGAGLLTIRAAIMFWTGSAFLFFIQPVAGTVATAMALAVTAFAGRPLLERLAHDYCPITPELSARLRQNRFFLYASTLWAVTYLINAGGTVWLLSSSSLASFLVLKTVMSPILTAIAAVLSYLTFRYLLRRDGVVVRFGSRPALAAA
jgi:hypothetical protein